MRCFLHRMLLLSLLFGQGVCAQEDYHQDELLSSDRPEAWAMNYMAASSFLTSFGESSSLAPWRWSAALELGEVPRLSTAQRQVGLNGTKVEDLNKSPVFGRLRLALGLPAGWVAELGYTPPLEINGTHGSLVALAFGHSLIRRENWNLSARAFGQHGSVRGDITCPEKLAGIADPELNPYGCDAASHDRVDLNYYGADLTAGWRRGGWHGYAGVGLVRTELTVRLDALTYSVRDRSRLTANGMQRYLTVGARRDFNPRWSVGAEWLYVPISVRRDSGTGSENDPLGSFRLQLRYQPDP
jgi:hypothetical protein